MVLLEDQEQEQFYHEVQKGHEEEQEKI